MNTTREQTQQRIIRSLLTTLKKQKDELEKNRVKIEKLQRENNLYKQITQLDNELNEINSLQKLTSDKKQNILLKYLKQ